MNINIRTAVIDDCERIRPLQKEIADLHHNGRPDLFKTEARYFTKEAFAERLSDSKHTIYIAETDNGEVVGYLAVLYVIESTAPTKHKNIGFECDFEIVPMTMYYQIRKGVDSNIFGCVDVMHITVNEENKTTEQLLHYFVKGTFITIEETAVATCAVIHVSSS